MFPAPLTGSSPRHSHSNSPRCSTHLYVSMLTCTRPGGPVLSILHACQVAGETKQCLQHTQSLSAAPHLLAMLTVDPTTQYRLWMRPITLESRGPLLIPTLRLAASSASSTVCEKRRPGRQERETTCALLQCADVQYLMRTVPLPSGFCTCDA